MEWIPDGKKFGDSRFDTVPACDRQTDRQMDGQTSCHGIVRAYAEYRAVAVNCMAIMPNMLHFGTAFGDLADVAKM